MGYIALVEAMDIPGRDFDEEVRRLSGLRNAIEMTMRHMETDTEDQDQLDSQEEHQEEFAQTTAAMAAEQSSGQETDNVY